MDDFSSISLLSLAMLVGCYVAGIIPLAVNFSEVSSTLRGTNLGGGGGLMDSLIPSDWARLCRRS